MSRRGDPDVADMRRFSPSRRRSHRGWPGRTCGGSDRSPNRSGRRWAPFVVSGAVASSGCVAVAALRQPARITGRHPRGHESACVYCPWRLSRRPESSPSATEAPRQGWPSGSALLTRSGVPSSGSWSRYRGAWSRLRGENERPCPDSQRRRGSSVSSPCLRKFPTPQRYSSGAGWKALMHSREQK